MFDWFATYVNNSSYDLITYVHNLYFNSVNKPNLVREAIEKRLFPVVP